MTSPTACTWIFDKNINTARFALMFETANARSEIEHYFKNVIVQTLNI